MDGGMVFMPGVPGFPPGASWGHKKPPAGAGAALVSYAGPRCMGSHSLTVVGQQQVVCEAQV